MKKIIFIELAIGIIFIGLVLGIILVISGYPIQRYFQEYSWTPQGNGVWERQDLKCEKETGYSLDVRCVSNCYEKGELRFQSRGPTQEFISMDVWGQDWEAFYKKADTESEIFYTKTNTGIDVICFLYDCEPTYLEGDIEVACRM